ncbi:hypothetical protein BGW39_011953, partial [Mortierella sp. 14UC]
MTRTRLALPHKKKITLLSFPKPSLLRLIAFSFPKAGVVTDWEENDYHIGFFTPEVLKEALDTPLVVNNYIVATIEALYSFGHRLWIRIDYLARALVTERQEMLKEMFKPY